MSQRQKMIIGAVLILSVGTAIYEQGQASQFQQKNLALQQDQALLPLQAKQLALERDELARQLALLRNENEKLDRNTPELIALRSEAARLRAKLQPSEQGDTGDPAFLAAKSILDRMQLLKDRFEKWPGKPTPELQLLNSEDWVNIVLANKSLLDTETGIRKTMSALRETARRKFGTAAEEAIQQFAKANNDQLPSKASQLAPYLKPPLDSYLENWEIAGPGWVNPPQPNSPKSENAKTWALVEKGLFSPDGIETRAGLSDPDFDSVIVVYRGGWYCTGAVIIDSSQIRE